MTDELPNDSQAMAVELVGANHDVLELGCGSGHVTERLVERGCRVTGIELDPEMAEQAKRFAKAVHIGDLDVVSPSDVLGESRFDRIVVGDVLEHLKDPRSTLAALASHLRPGGLLVASLPNVTHADVRLMLLDGHWRYQDSGLMDRTHLRFFDREGVAELFASAGWRIERLEHATKAPLTSELVELAAPASTIAGVMDAIESDPDSDVYQFIVVATPGTPSDVETVADRGRGERPGRTAPEQGRLLAENAQLRVRVRELEERLEDALWVKAVWRARLTRAAALPRRLARRAGRTT